MLATLLFCDSCRIAYAFLRMGFGWNTGFIPYGERWKGESSFSFASTLILVVAHTCTGHRKVFRQEIEGHSSAAYHDCEIHEARLLLRRLLNDPENYRKSIRL